MPSRKVLVVEDNLDARASLVALLEADGHNVRSAASGEDALIVASTFAPEVVLLDLGLSGISGYEVCSQLKRAPGLNRVRVIVISGYDDPDDRKRSAAAGCDVHLPKTVNPREILKLVAAPIAAFSKSGDR